VAEVRPPVRIERGMKRGSFPIPFLVFGKADEQYFVPCRKVEVPVVRRPVQRDVPRALAACVAGADPHELPATRGLAAPGIERGEEEVSSDVRIRRLELTWINYEGK